MGGINRTLSTGRGLVDRVQAGKAKKNAGILCEMATAGVVFSRQSLVGRVDHQGITGLDGMGAVRPEISRVRTGRKLTRAGIVAGSNPGPAATIRPER